MPENEKFKPEIRLLTVAEYLKMAEVGILNEEDYVELIEGRLIKVGEESDAHAGVVTQLTRLLNRVAGEKALVWVQNPVMLDRHSMPEPDIALIKYRSDFYKSRHVEPDDVLLIIEVADDAVRYDKEIKTPLYARHAIPETWVIDFNAQSLIRHRQPVAGVYLQIDTLEKPNSLPITALQDAEIDLSCLFFNLF